MMLSYRKETNQELLRAAATAYAQAPPAHNTRRGAFSRTLSPSARPSETSSRRAADNTNIPA